MHLSYWEEVFTTVGNVGIINRRQAMKLRYAVLLVACAITFGQARAAESTMPIHFVGDWCFQSQQNNTITYALPSWTEDGRCTKILSIHEYGFYGHGNHCKTVNISLRKDTAPSGTAYTAQLTAHCQPDGPVNAGRLQTYKLERYKGHLSVSAK
jgi:hypothetical protein